jgi:hypothetical protein
MCSGPPRDLCIKVDLLGILWPLVRYLELGHNGSQGSSSWFCFLVLLSFCSCRLVCSWTKFCFKVHGLGLNLSGHCCLGCSQPEHLGVMRRAANKPVVSLTPFVVPYIVTGAWGAVAHELSMFSRSASWNLRGYLPAPQPLSPRWMQDCPGSINAWVA